MAKERTDYFMKELMTFFAQFKYIFIDRKPTFLISLRVRLIEIRERVK